MKVNLHREKSRGTSGRRGRFDLPAAVLTALAVQIFFWLPLEYREERIAAADNGDNISVLGPGSFSADGLRRFEIWMKRHDPAAFSRSDSSSGYAASLPEIQPQELPAVIAAAAAGNIAIPSPKPFTALKTGKAAKGVLLPPVTAAAAGKAPASAAAAAVLSATVTDDLGNILENAANWQIPAHHTAGSPTVLALSGLAGDPCWEVVRSCGDDILDTLAMRQLDGRRKTVEPGRRLMVHWRMKPEVKK